MRYRYRFDSSFIDSSVPLFYRSLSHGNPRCTCVVVVVVAAVVVVVPAATTNNIVRCLGIDLINYFTVTPSL